MHDTNRRDVRWKDKRKIGMNLVTGMKQIIAFSTILLRRSNFGNSKVPVLPEII
jgi:hypothetical protein